MFNPLLIATIMGINCLFGGQFIPAAYEESQKLKIFLTVMKATKYFIH